MRRRRGRRDCQLLLDTGSRRLTHAYGLQCLQARRNRPNAERRARLRAAGRPYQCGLSRHDLRAYGGGIPSRVNLTPSLDAQLAGRGARRSSDKPRCGSAARAASFAIGSPFPRTAGSPFRERETFFARTKGHARQSPDTNCVRPSYDRGTRGGGYSGVGSIRHSDEPCDFIGHARDRSPDRPVDAHAVHVLLVYCRTHGNVGGPAGPGRLWVCLARSPIRLFLSSPLPAKGCRHRRIEQVAG